MKTVLAAVAAVTLLLSNIAVAPTAYAQEKGKSAESKGKAEEKGKSETKGKDANSGKAEAKGKVDDAPKGKGK